MKLAHLEALPTHLPGHLVRWVPQFVAAEICFEVPACLMAAIVDRESKGGLALVPPNPGGTGDGGHGRGLAQIDDRSHHRFIVATFDDGHTPLWAEPTFNVLYGARLLSVGHRASKSWPVAIAGYNAGLSRALRVQTALSDSSEAALVSSLDRITTGGDYVSAVLRKMSDFGPPLPPLEVS